MLVISVWLWILALQLHPSLPDPINELLRTSEFHEGERARRGRLLLQASSSSAPAGATNSAGLLLCNLFMNAISLCKHHALISASNLCSSISLPLSVIADWYCHMICCVKSIVHYILWLIIAAKALQWDHELAQVDCWKRAIQKRLYSLNFMHADTPVNRTALDPDDFGNFFFNAYNNNSVKGIALTPGNYQVIHLCLSITWICL